MMLSSHAWKAMGFQPIAESEPIAARFYSVHIHEVQGFVVADDAPVLTHHGEVSGAAYAMALGTSVNQLARAVSVDEFTDDEPSWTTEHKCTPPYVLIHFGPSEEHSCSSGYIKDEGPTLATSNCFSAARAQIHASECKVLPSLISALTCKFGSAEHPVRFKPIDKLFFGLTTNNRILHDVRFEARGSAYSSKRLTDDETRAALANAAAFADQINPKVSRFLQLALEEDDLLKRFLYYFLSIEIETHSAFSSIEHSIHIASMIKGPDRLRKTSSQFFEAQREKWTTLKDRFVWCALCIWTHLTDADIDQFTRLKKIRDDIAHGSIAVPPPESVVAAGKLAESLHRMNAGA